MVGKEDIVYLHHFLPLFPHFFTSHMSCVEVVAHLQLLKIGSN